jgi:hypothetical protein
MTFKYIILYNMKSYELTLFIELKIYYFNIDLVKPNIKCKRVKDINKCEYL